MPARPPAPERRPRRRPRRLWPWLLLGFPTLGLVAACLLLTDSRPLADERPSPDPRQAAAAHAALDKVLHSPASGSGPATIALSASELRDLAVVAGSALRPARIDMDIDEYGFHAFASRPLPLGRWLNAAFYVAQPTGEPAETRMSLGSIELGPRLTPLAVRIAMRAFRLKTDTAPDVGALLRSLRLADGRLSFAYSPAEYRDFAGRLLAGRGGAGAGEGEGDIARLYCRLADVQRRQPTDRFATLVRRAFAPPVDDAEAPQANRAALLALAMQVVDPRIGYLAGVSPTQVAGCAVGGPEAVLHGRADSPKHWLVSAALAAAVGGDVSRATGEWKELADSVSSRPEFARGDPTGFSWVDIGADRSGELIARAATSPDRAMAVRQALAAAGDETLMPSALLRFPDGMSAAAFQRDFGGTDDPRYRARRGEIDAIIRARTPAR